MLEDAYREVPQRGVCTRGKGRDTSDTDKIQELEEKWTGGMR